VGVAGDVAPDLVLSLSGGLTLKLGDPYIGTWDWFQLCALTAQSNSNSLLHLPSCHELILAVLKWVERIILKTSLFVLPDLEQPSGPSSVH
jgi:hypothetical protein